MAIQWFTNDTSRTRQAVAGPEGPVSPGQLLAAARYEMQLDGLLGSDGHDTAPALVEAQARWLIQHMPDDQHPSLDSAQQAGRAWGILVTADSEALPAHDVLAEVRRRTGISVRAAEEIVVHAQHTAASYNRADLLVPYDHAPDHVLVADWNRLAACGRELPEAAERAQDVLELLTARVTGSDDHAWMDVAAQHAAQIYDSVIKAQPLLAPLAALIPHQGHTDAADMKERLVQLHQKGALADAATAAARARAIQDWASHNTTPELARAKTVEAAAPGMCSLVRLNSALASLDPSHSDTAPLGLDHDRIAQIVEAMGRLAARTAETLRPAASPLAPPAAEHHRATHHHRHQPPEPGVDGSTPRPTP
ncbi:hypothetical protein ACFU5O_28170 [Streptomyces sp. NPDC057445]|uniref:hypothetical protein n=1 Tax=Streptomyces sp. NPDC057445 TaxID=3346136 RepID=UPI00368558B1